ncbi:TPA: hypothetical protein ACLLGK_001053 [Enterobacter roggenkampii]
MTLADTKKLLLDASKTEGDFLVLVNDLYLEEIQSEEKILTEALTELHNSSEIDLIGIVAGIEKNSSYDFLIVVTLFENALPSLNTKTEDVLHCLAYLVQLAERNHATVEVYKAFERFCSLEAHRPRESIEYIIRQKELSSYAPFLPCSILAYGSERVDEAIQAIESLIISTNESVRNHAYFSLGRLVIDDARADYLWELLTDNAFSEQDISCCISILRAILNFGESFPSYWPKIEMYLTEVVKEAPIEFLYEISRLIAFQKNDISKPTVLILIERLANASLTHEGIIRNIDYLLVNLLEMKSSALVIELLELIMNVGVKINNLSYFSSQLMDKYQDLRNHILTKWFLSEDLLLCRGALDLLNGVSGKDIELYADAALLDTEVKKIFVCRKAVGWLFTIPVVTVRYIMSIVDSASEETSKELESILYDPLLISYPGELTNVFQSFIEGGIHKSLCERLLEKLKSYNNNIEKISKLSELKAPSENINIYWKNFDKSMQVAHEKASKNSFLHLIAKTQRLLYGNSSVYYVEQQNGKSIRQEVKMHSFSHSTEMPRLDVFDPVSLNNFLLMCRCERMNDEINS